jgi:hypothetical protein
MKQTQADKVDIESEEFAIRALRSARDLLVETRMRGESVYDEGDFLARAMDQTYMDAGAERRASARRRGNG